MTASKNQAIQTALEGNWQDATEINKAIINNNPRDIEALNRLALAYSIQGQIKKAKFSYKKVLEIDPLNPIALKNIKRLSDLFSQKNKKKKASSTAVNYAFIEETGKTKIVALINIAPPKVIATLVVGQPLAISIKRSKIFFQDQNKNYIGALPDDVGKRLIRFVKGGNKYETYLKSAASNSVVVFIKEELKKAMFKDNPSFLQTTDNSLVFEKKRILNNQATKAAKIGKD